MDKDVIHCRWLVECIQENQIASLNPAVMIYTSAATRQFFKTKMDQYLDDYTADATLETIKTSLARAASRHTDTVQQFNALSILSIHSKYSNEMSSVSRLSFMKPVCAVYCSLSGSTDTVHLDSMFVRMQLFGAKLIRPNETRQPYHIPISHVICDSLPKSTEDFNALRIQLAQYSSFMAKPDVICVTPDWIEKCMTSMRMVEPILNINCCKSSILANMLQRFLPSQPSQSQPRPSQPVRPQTSKVIDITTPQKKPPSSKSQADVHDKVIQLVTPAKQAKTKRKRVTTDGSPLQQKKKPKNIKPDSPKVETPPKQARRKQPKSPIHKTPDKPSRNLTASSPIDLITPSPAPKPRKTICLGPASPCPSPDLFATPKAPSRVRFTSPPPVTPSPKPRKTIVLQEFASPELF